MKEEHNMRIVGYSIILMAASLAAIAGLYLAIGENVLFADQIQREKQDEYKECVEKNMQGSECQKFLKQKSVADAFLESTNEQESSQPEAEEPITNEAIEAQDLDEPVSVKLSEELSTEEKLIEETGEENEMQPQTISVEIASGTSVPGCETTNECYIPYEISINVGDTVVWENQDTAAHTVSSGTPEDGIDGNFDSSLFMSGNSFEVTFNSSGEYPYFCMVHPWMNGIVRVS